MVGPDMKSVNRAMASIRISYDDIPIESYIENKDDESGGKEIFDNGEWERTVEYGDCFTMESGIRKGIDAEMKESEVRVQNDWTYSFCPRNYRETCGALCSFSGDSLNVYSPSQWISNLREYLSVAMKLSSDKINVIRTKDWERSTNSIWYNSVIACQAAVASYKLNVPVKLIYSRQEQEDYIDCMKPIHFHTELGATRSGKLKALKVEASLDSGSTNVFIGEIIDRIAIAASSCYKADNISIQVKAKSSNTPPLSIDMQLIDTASFFAMENALSALVRKLNKEPGNSLIFPNEIRKMNLNNMKTDDQLPDMPFSFQLPKAEECIDKLFESSDFNNKYIFYNRESLARAADFSKQFLPSPFVPPIRGIGFAAGYEGSFYYGSKIYGADQELEVTLEKDGSLPIHSPPLSDSIEDIWIRLASDILDIKTSRIKINSNFEGGSEPFLPESAYANISIMTVLLKKCCETIKKKKDKDELPISVTHELRSVQKKTWDNEKFRGEPFHSCSFAAATVEVELDSHTFSDRIKKIHINISGGHILNSNAAEASIKLGIQKVLSTLTEGRKAECDDINITFMNGDGNPEQIGELVYQVIPSAYLQALSQALGTQLDTLPVQYDRIYQEIKTLQSQKAPKPEDTEENKPETRPIAPAEEVENADSTDAKR